MSVCCAWKEKTEKSKQQNTLEFLMSPRNGRNNGLEHYSGILLPPIKNKQKTILLVTYLAVAYDSFLNMTIKTTDVYHCAAWHNNVFYQTKIHIQFILIY